MENQEINCSESFRSNTNSRETLESFFNYLEQLKYEFDATSKSLEKERKREKELEEQVNHLFQRMKCCQHQTEVLIQKKQKISQQKEMRSMTVSLRNTIQQSLLEEHNRLLHNKKSLKEEIKQIQNQILKHTLINDKWLDINSLKHWIQEDLNEQKHQYQKLKSQVNMQQEQRQQKEFKYKQMISEKEKLEREIKSLRNERKNLQQQVNHQRQEMKRQEQLRIERRATIRKANQQRKYQSMRYNNFSNYNDKNNSNINNNNNNNKPISNITHENCDSSVSFPYKTLSDAPPPRKVPCTSEQSTATRSPFKFKPVNNTQSKQAKPSFKKVSDILAEQNDNSSDSNFSFDLL